MTDSPLPLVCRGCHVDVEPPAAAGRRTGYELFDVVCDELSSAGDLSVRTVCDRIFHVRNG